MLHWIQKQVSGFWTALQFLTIFPAPARIYGNTGLGSSLWYFPLVGIFLGGILLALDQLFQLFLPEILIGALLLVTMVVLTGALHLDGLMDTCDGFAVRMSSDERLKVMADSHVGGFGVAGALCLLLVKFAAVVSLPGELRAVGLILMPVIARGAVIYPILAFPSARKGGLGDLFKQETGRGMIYVTAFFTLAFTSIFLFWIGPVLIAGVWLISFILAKMLSRRLGGLTGDTYGAIIEVSEACILIGIIIIWEAGGTSWLGSYL